MVVHFAISLLISSIVFPSVSLVFVLLRFYGQKKSLRNLWPIRQLYGDEILIVLAWLLALGFAIENIVSIFVGGVGKQIESLSPEQQVMFFKLIWAQQFFYYFSTTCVKLSILIFYKRIFPFRHFVFRANILAVFALIWLVVFFFMTIFQWWPVSGFWTMQGHRLYDFYIMYLVAGILDLVLDVCILCLPMTEIPKLKIARNKKITVIIMFGLGFFSCLASGIRIYYLAATERRQNDLSLFSNSIAYVAMWSLIECCWSVTCACMPTLGPYLKSRRMRRIFSSVRRSNNRTSASHPISGNTFKNKPNTFKWSSSGGSYARDGHERIPSLINEGDEEMAVWVPPSPPARSSLRPKSTYENEITRTENLGVINAPANAVVAREASPLGGIMVEERVDITRCKAKRAELERARKSGGMGMGMPYAGLGGKGDSFEVINASHSTTCMGRGSPGREVMREGEGSVDRGSEGELPLVRPHMAHLGLEGRSGSYEEHFVKA